MIWDSDVNPEGLSLGYERNFSNFFVESVGSYYWVNELSSSDKDVVLQSGQLSIGLENDRLKVRFGASIYSYLNIQSSENIVGSDNFSGNTGRLAEDGENQLYANDYRLQNYFAEVAFKDLPVIFFYDTVVNHRVKEQNSGYLLGFSVASTKSSFPIKFKYSYREVEKESIFGLFADSDFIGGGSDGRGHAAKLSYGLTNGVKLGYTYFQNEKKISQVNPIAYQRSQADIAVKF